MFLDFYKLREQPFGVTPDPRFLYLGATHREALASLFYGIQTGRGFLALIAEPGMGKTTLLSQLREQLQPSARTVFLFQTQCDARELLRYLLGNLGLDNSSQDIVVVHERLNEVLAREMLAGRHFVLMIDEAQNLGDSALETVRLLSDFETPTAKMLQIILVGQPQLACKLAQPGLAQLRQRIGILGRLEPFDAAETARYIGHRLQAAGYEGGPLFTLGAVEVIAARSQGIPRNINNLCFGALSAGYALSRQKIDSAIVEEVVADLDMDALARKTRATERQIPLSRPQRSQLSSPRVEEVVTDLDMDGLARKTRATERQIPLVRPQRSQLSSPRVEEVVTDLDTDGLARKTRATERQIPLVRPQGPQLSYPGVAKSSLGLRVVRTAALPALLALGGLLWFSPLRRPSQAAPDPPSPEAVHAAVTPAASEPLGPSTEPGVPAASLPSADAPLEQASPKVRSAETFTVMVGPKQTLRQISLQYLGWFDDRLIEEIRELNPGITDPNRIEIGQQIRLPRRSRTSEAGSLADEGGASPRPRGRRAHE